MAIDDRVEPPAEKPTVEIAKVPAWAIELTTAMKTGIAEVRADIGLVSNDLGVLKQRVSIIEGLRNSEEARASKLSGGVRGLSNATLEHDAQLAAERMARETLAAKVDALTASQELQLAILSRLDKVMSNSSVKVILGVLAMAAASWAATKGLK